MMAKILLRFCLLLVAGCAVAESSSHEDWGLLKRGWNWFSWYYYWYWQHGHFGHISDHDTICQRLWGNDHNRMQYRVDYDIFLQERIMQNSTVDKARGRLFRFVNMTKVQRKPTYRAFIDLLKDFHPSSYSTVSHVGRNKTRKHMNGFLSTVMKTRVFQELYWYLVRNNFIYPDKAQFKDTLFNLWFNRGNITTENPTAFQKIFVGEIVRNPYKLSVRNWIQFAMLESRRLNYYGYMHYYPYDPKVVSMMFSWNRGAPVTDNMLIGTSPEFELALYTLCFFTRPTAECECKVNIRKIVVTTTTSSDGSKILNSHFELKF